MGSKSSSAPPAPDPYATANAQYTYNTSAADYNAALNRINTYTPLGSQTYSQNGVDPATGAPIWSQNINLTPAAQSIYNQQLQQNQALGNLNNNMLSQVQNAYQNPIDTSGINPIATGVDPSQGFQSGVYNPALQYNVNQGNIQGQLDTSGIPGIAGAGDLAGYTQQMQDAAYKNQQQYLDPQFNTQQQALQTQLVNQGATPGSPAWETAMRDFNNTKQQAYTNAYNNSFQTGLAGQQALYGESANTNNQLYNQLLNSGNFANAAQAQQFGQGMQNAGLYNSAAGQNFQQGQQNAALNNTVQNNIFQQGQQNAALNNSASAQQMQQLFALQNQPMNQFNALRSASQVQMPQFQSTYNPTAASPDYQGAANTAYQGQIASANAQNASSNSLMSGLFGLGGSLLSGGSGSLGSQLGSALFSSSDAILKHDIKRIGLTPRGIPVYSFKYAGSDVTQIGVMAQEAREFIPDAVVEDEHGYLKVDYSKVA